jgi:glyoxylase-like metal-dependent hydrolase (beta-lactamase superfamily II)
MKKNLCFLLLFCSVAACIFAQDTDGVFSFKAGRFEVYMLVEAERDGNTSIIPDANEAVIQRYIPGTGFKHSTNVFLIKAPGQNILVDTAFGGAVFEKMNKLGVRPDDVDAVLITHLHGDHFGGLQKEGKALLPKAKIYLAAREYEHFTKTAVNQGAVDALSPYGSSVITFNPASSESSLREILPGISAIANYGHTPGHTAFLVEDAGEGLIIAGDFLHIALIQFPMPEISATYDIDRAMAAASRRQLMELAAEHKVPIGGMHIVYPGIGYVQKEGNGFSFIPVR